MANNAVVGVLRALLQVNTAEYEGGLKRSAAATRDFAKTAETTVTPALSKVEAQMLRTERASARMVSYLQGDKLIASANQWVAAAQKAGGATKLTEAEQAKLNATLTKAIEKYKVLGETAPKAMLDLERATRKAGAVTASVSNPKDTLAAAGGAGFTALVGPLGVAALATGGALLLKRLTSEAIESASAMVDLSNKTGLSTEMLQRMQFVAGQAGGSLDDFATASFKLGARLAGGGSSVRQALRDLGLELTEIQKLSPDQQFLKVVDALHKVNDATELNRIGIALFGKSFSQIASAVHEGFSQIAQGATIATDAQIHAIDDAADRFDKFIEKQKTKWKAFLGDLLKFPENSGIRSVAEELAQLDARDRARSGYRAPGAAAIAPSFIQQLKEMDAELSKLTATEREDIDAAIAMGKTNDEIEKKYPQLEGAIGRYKEQIRDATKATKEHDEAIRKADEQLQHWNQVAKQAREELRAEREAVRDLQSDMMSLADAIDAVAQREGSRDAVKSIEEGSDALETQIDLLMRQADDEQKMRDNEIEAQGEIVEWQKKREEQAKALHRAEIERQRQFTDGWLFAIDAIAESFQSLSSPGGAMSEFFSALQIGARSAYGLRESIDNIRLADKNSKGAAIAGNIGGIGASAVGAYGGLMQATATGSTTARTLKGGAFGAAEGSQFGVYGAAVGFGIGAITGYYRGQEATIEDYIRRQIAFGAWMQDMAKQAGPAIAGTTMLSRANETLTRSYQEIGKTADDAFRDINELQRASIAGNDAYNQQLGKINANIERASKLTDARAQKQQLLNDAVERYGFTFEEAGRIFQRQSLADQAEQLIQDWKLLVESGADPSLIAQRMSAAASAFVQEAVKTGTQIPEELRPMLEEMSDLGLLLDENGRNFRVDMLKFGAQLEVMFTRVLDKLEALIDALTNPDHVAVPRGTVEPVAGGSQPSSSGPSRRPPRAHSGWFVGDLGPDEHAAILQNGEAVLSRGLMRMLGGRAAFDALNAGEVPPGLALPDLHAYAAAALPDNWSLPGGLSAPTGSFSEARREDAGDINVSVAQVTVKADRPEEAAQAFLDALPVAVSRNRKGLRTRLRRHLGTP